MKKNYDRSRRNRKSAVAGSLGKGGTAQDQGGRAAAPARDIQLPLDRFELIGMIQDEVHSFAVRAGLVIAKMLLQDEVDQLCGERPSRSPTDVASGH